MLAEDAAIVVEDVVVAWRGQFWIDFARSVGRDVKLVWQGVMRLAALPPVGLLARIVQAPLAAERASHGTV